MKMKKIIFILIIIMLVVPFFSQAAGTFDPKGDLAQAEKGLYQGAQPTSLPVYIGMIIRYVLGTVGVVLTVIIVYAGFLWLTAGGNSDQVGKAKKLLINGFVGLLITLGANSIAHFVIDRLTDNSQPNEWVEIGEQPYKPLSEQVRDGDL